LRVAVFDQLLIVVVSIVTGFTVRAGDCFRLAGGGIGVAGDAGFFFIAEYLVMLTQLSPIVIVKTLLVALRVGDLLQFAMFGPAVVAGVALGVDDLPQQVAGGMVMVLGFLAVGVGECAD